MSEPSGPEWTKKFPTSVELEPLEDAFETNLRKFLGALAEAQAVVKINATKRPEERAFLMHFAWKIARESMDPRKIPAHPNVAIDWVHRDDQGHVDFHASRRAAEKMVVAYDLAVLASLTSAHISGRAVDMSISWSGVLRIRNRTGVVTTISSSPRTGMNEALITVGQSYGVLKLRSDPPHWSSTGH